MPWSHPARAHARVHPRDARDLGVRGTTATKLDFRGDFYQHTLMTPFFAPRPEPVRRAEGVPRRGRRADDRGRGRGRRRHHHPRLHDRAVRQGGDAARDRARPRQGAAAIARRLRDLGSVVRRHRHATRRSSTSARAGRAAADRVLRLDARVPRRARAARLGRSADRAQHAVEAGRVGARWASSSTTTILDTFAVVAEPEGVGAELQAPLRRRRRPVLVLRAVPSRSRALGRRHRRPQDARSRRSSRRPRAAGSTQIARSSGSSCGPKWPRRGHHLERRRAGAAATIRSPNVGRDVGARLAAHDAHRALRPSGSVAERAVVRRHRVRCAPRPRAGTSSSNTPSPRSRRP